MEPNYQNGLPQQNQYSAQTPPPPPQAPIQPPVSNQYQNPPQAPAREKNRTDIKAFLLNLGIIVSLSSVYSSFLSFVFDLLNVVFPDSLDSGYSSYSLSWQDSSIRWAMAMIVVGVPVYLILSWLVNRHVRTLAENSAGNQTGGRKFLSSIIIFLSSATVITSLVSIVYYFFGGEITVRFVLKSLTVLLSAGGILWYYINEIKRDPLAPSLSGKVGAVVLIAVVIVSIILGFVVIGSPMQARLLKLDQTRVSHLQNISSNVGSYWRNKYALPQTLNEMVYFSGNSPKDPVSGKDYVYKVVDQRHFSVCATFEASSQVKPGNNNNYYGYANTGITDWTHGVGEKCFDGYLDPSVYTEPVVVSVPTASVPVPKIR